MPNTDRALKWRRFRAALMPERGYSRCYHCRMPWHRDKRKPHLLRYQLDGRLLALFLTCEWCWPRTTADQRVGYLRHLLWTEWHGWPAPGTKTIDELDRIEAVVLPQLADEPDEAAR